MGIVRVFFDADMRFGINGLSEIIHKKTNKTDGRIDAFLFINRKKNYFKVINNAGYMLAFKSDSSLTIDQIRQVPQFFNNKAWMQASIVAELSEVLGERLKHAV